MFTIDDIINDLVLNEQFVHSLSTVEYLSPEEVDDLLKTLDDKSETTELTQGIQNQEFDLKYFEETFEASKTSECFDLYQREPTMTLNELQSILMSPDKSTFESSESSELLPFSEISCGKQTKLIDDLELPVASSGVTVTNPKFKILDHHVFHLPETDFHKSSSSDESNPSIEIKSPKKLKLKKKCEGTKKVLCKKKQVRTTFTKEQVQVLEFYYSQNQYPNHALRNDLAKDFNLDGQKIKVWFDNRRQKQRKLNNK